MPAEKRLYVVDLPNISEYRGRVTESIHFGHYSSKEDALRRVLAKHNCLYLLEELLPYVDEIVTDDRREIARYARIKREERKSRKEGQRLAEEAALRVDNEPVPKIPEDSDDPFRQKIYDIARRGVKRERVGYQTERKEE